MQRACRRVHAIAVGPIHTVSQHAKQIVHTSAAVRRKVKRTHVRIGSKVLHDGGNSIELFLDELGRGTVAVVPEIVLDIDIFATQSTGTFKL